MFYNKSGVNEGYEKLPSRVAEADGGIQGCGGPRAGRV
jgi:hypothetical protein